MVSSLLLSSASLLRRQQAMLLERLVTRAASAPVQQHQQRASMASASALAPPVSRDSRFARLRDDDLAFFRDVLGEGGVVTGGDALEPYTRCVWVAKRDRAID